MQKLTVSYTDNIRKMDVLLRVNENFDIIKKTLVIADSELTLYYIDGFVKDGAMQKLMIYLLSIKEIKSQGAATTAVFVNENIPYVEAEATDSVDQMLHMVMSGATLVLGKHFGDSAILIDARTYPARSPQEPESDRVIRGARDGFVETLIFNTALIRRRIRDTSLTMHYMSIGSSSKTDVVLCYMADRADPGYVSKIKERLASIETQSLTMGHQSIAECLIKTNWYNPFPKIRCTERPDNAAAHLEEGRLILLCDNTPEAMILPTSLFDFLQETNDYYFPPLTGTYLRLVRHAVSWLTLFMIPIWYLLINNVELVPDWLAFIIPSDRGRLPILAQLLITEFIIDGMRMASMNTPNMLTNSLSVVGGLILGDFAITIGWLIPEVILYMAFVTIANFSQSSYELGYAFKFMRILLLILVALFNVWGFAAGLALIVLLIATNKTVNGNRNYLYPLIPFNARAMAALLFRVKKNV